MGSFLLFGGMGFLIFLIKGSFFLPRGMWAKSRVQDSELTGWVWSFSFLSLGLRVRGT